MNACFPVVDWLPRHASERPEKIALVTPAGAVSYAEFHARVEALAQALVAAGVRPGDAVAQLSWNSESTLLIFFACARLAAIFMPLNWRLAPPEHRDMLADCTPRVCFVAGPFLDQSENLRRDFPRIVFVAEVPRATWLDRDTFLARGANQPLAPPRAAPEAPLLICYTSGSTGKPKGVLLTQDALAWNAVNSADMHALCSQDVILTTLPLFHVGGLNIQTTPALAAGATVVLHPKFEVEATFDALEGQGITLTVLVPAQLDMMMASPRWRGADLSRLRAITTGSTIVPDRVTTGVQARGIPLLPVYGATETCPIAVYLKAADAGRRVGSTGRVAKHGELLVLSDSGAPLAAGQVGEISIRGPQVMQGYWQAPETTKAALVEGWFRTGDLGFCDAEGFVTVVGRKKDMIISGGENIYPAEVENRLAEHPAIAEVSVVGRPDPRWGELVVAVIVPKPGHALILEDVHAFLEGRIARYKFPKEVLILPELPKSALGKVRKDELRRMAEAGVPALVQT
ncbi:MAG: AMP-binding protein [Betaproteobacteria bacterium]|nr:AMP-binding protein [Betaproteobacteria bacterium]